MIQCRHFYNQLTSKEKRIYDDLYHGATRCMAKIKTIPVPDPKPVMDHVFAAIMSDNPMLYYVDQMKMNYTYSKKEIIIEPTYHFSVGEINAYNRMIQERAAQIIDHVIRIGGNDPVRREIALYEYFAKHFKYDKEAIGSKDPFISCKAHSLLGVFLEGKSVCEGFAEAFLYLLNAMNIECIRVSGCADLNYAQRHAWNIVKLNNKYYHVDVTWAISRNEGGLIWYDYLNMSDKEAAIDHGDFSGVPRCTSDDLDYYKRNDLEIRSKKVLKERIKTCLMNRGREISFRLVRGWGLDAIAHPENGVPLIEEMTNKAHRECRGPGISYVTNYNNKKGTYIVRYTYK